MVAWEAFGAGGCGVGSEGLAAKQEAGCSTNCFMPVVCTAYTYTERILQETRVEYEIVIHRAKFGALGLCQ